MMRFLDLRYIFFVLVLLLVGCRKDEKTDGTIVVEPTGDPMIEVVSGVTGIVVDENNLPISNATVSVYDKDVITDENGIFYINNEGLRQLRSSVRVEKQGFFDGFKSFYPAVGQKSFLRIQMIARGSAKTFDSPQGGTITFEDKAELTIPAQGVVIKDGGANYDGIVNVYAHWYDPTDPDLGLSMPGNLLARDANDVEIQLGTYGMIAVELESPGGDALQLAPGIEATLKFPVPSSLDPPQSIPLWSFDELDGLWIEEGEANLEDGSYIAKVNHFSFWNCDAPFPLINLEGRLVDDGIPVANYLVKITSENLLSGFGYTNSEGIFRGKVPKNEALNLSVFRCNQTLHIQDIGPFDADVNLGDIPIQIQEFVTTLQGTMADCNFVPQQSSFGLIKQGDIVVQVVTSIADGTSADGTFSTVLAGCGTENFTIQFFDPVTKKSSGIIDINTELEINDFGLFTICDDLDEFIEFSINGESVPLMVEADVYVSNEEKLIIRGGSVGTFESFDMDVFATTTGLYNTSSMSIQSLVGPANPELQMMCGDHITNAFVCDQFEVNIISFTEYIAGTFEGTLVSFADSLGGFGQTFDEYSVEGSFRLKIDDNINTGEISGRLWVDEDGSSTRDVDETLLLRAQSISIIPDNTPPIALFPTFIYSYDNAYKFTNLLDGTYFIRIYDGNDYRVVEYKVGDEDTDCDFVDTGNYFSSSNIFLDSEEVIDNIDIGFEVPTSVNLGAYYFGCAPNIGIVGTITGGLPPYHVTLSDGQTLTTDSNPFFNVSQGGTYTIHVIDEVGNEDTREITIEAYNNRIRGRVWQDSDQGEDGVFDSGDDHLSEVLISVFNESEELVAETLCVNGWYSFDNFEPGNYYIVPGEFGNLEISPQNSSILNGNDVNPDTGRTDLFFVENCNAVVQIDIGLK